MADQIRLREIDESNRDDHSRLTADDVCYFLFEYTSRKGYSFSTTNQLISNLKKKPSGAGRPGYQYKAHAIRECAAYLTEALNPKWLAKATLVPVPCSKAKDHPDFDDRVERICRSIGPSRPDVRALIVQTESTDASHEVGDGDRTTVEELLEIYRIDEALADPPPSVIAIVDDVLTVGTHYRAMHTKLSERFPGVRIVGVFIARRIFPTITFENLE
ncbi:hypothetical protein CHU95_03255 [Niveispirillum lacus]|uniref:Phosphoribosyltransferase n=1 Tax=Niveispirillum lacus TaxID=1981099 RepID=A0A255Z5U2_9PROT|nr:hypothetical protein [Niveispirillum lacus]OYQ36802.1 hypothetical protein CHU95_03255 [Niveispirillum lacus]